MLNEDFNESLDLINDELTTISEHDFEGVESVEKLLFEIDLILNKYQLKIDLDDVEELVSDWEEPTDEEAVAVVLPVYQLTNEDSEFNLSLTYALNENTTYLIDIELQYEWEVDDEFETEYVEFGN